MLASRPLFYTAAAFNLGAGLPLLLATGLANQLLDLRLNASGAAMLQIIAAVAATFGVAYAMAGRHPQRNRPVIWLGCVLKLVLASMVTAAWLAGTIGWQLPALTVVDIAYALLFFLYLKQHPAR